MYYSAPVGGFAADWSRKGVLGEIMPPQFFLACSTIAAVWM
jgi:hypothetical protein